MKCPFGCAQAPGVTLAFGWHFRPQGRGEDGVSPKARSCLVWLMGGSGLLSTGSQISEGDRGYPPSLGFEVGREKVSAALKMMVQEGTIRNSKGVRRGLQQLVADFPRGGLRDSGGLSGSCFLGL